MNVVLFFPKGDYVETLRINVKNKSESATCQVVLAHVLAEHIDDTGDSLVLNQAGRYAL